MKLPSRLTPLLMAAVLPMLIFALFVPKGVVQLDLGLLWLSAMVLLGLPMVLLELALSKRSQKLPWQGMQVLTREADAKITWRAFSYLSVFLSLLLAAAMVAQSAKALVELQALSHIPTYAIAFVLMVVALILSPLKERLLLVGAVLAIVSGVVGLILMPTITASITDISFGEWAIAVVMALFGVGLGTGLYWFIDNKETAKKETADKKRTLSRQALPIWATQLVCGALAFVSYSVAAADMVAMIGVGGVLLVSAFLLNYAMTELKVRFGVLMGVAITVVLALALSALPAVFFVHLLVFFGLLCVLVLSLFAGWAMKISHLRKALNFKTELRYNLWRIAVRWLIPLAVVSAWVGYLMG